ncbi:hypothetical protein [Sphingobium sp. MI1205]|nr:hypothetical protein [Sphingobium sp. MI1205]
MGFPHQNEMMEVSGHVDRGWVNDGEAAAKRGAEDPILLRPELDL